MLERFQVRYHPGGAESITDNGDEPDDEAARQDDQEVRPGADVPVAHARGLSAGERSVR